MRVFLSTTSSSFITYLNKTKTSLPFSLCAIHSDHSHFLVSISYIHSNLPMLSGLMNMEGIRTEEHVAVGSCNNNSHVIKRKRTKRRLKPLSPCVFTATSTAVTSSCSSASCGGGGGSFSSTTFEGTDQEEDQDMAKCLILLAQGKREREEEEEESDRDPNHHHQQQQQQYKLQKAENHVMVTKGGLDNYECKTCNRTFPSFQALGGHRASHKKPKIQMEKKSSPPPLPITTTTGTTTAAREFEEGNYDYKQSHMVMKNIITNAPPISLELGCGVVNNKPSKPNKIHECSICGSEFSSGQALGGHMRRHRASTSSNNNNNNVDPVTTLSVFDDVNVKSRNVLELDLNLPAPDDDLQDSKFQFPATRKPVVLSSAPALVGCHY